MNYPFFDAYVRIGPRANKHPHHAWTLAQVRDEMAHCSIAGALVTHTLCVTYDPMLGNRRLCRELEPYPELYPLWNAMPHHTGEFPTPEDLVREMRDHDVRAVTLHPATNAWEPLSDMNRGLFETLEAHTIPVIVTPAEVGGFAALEQILKRHPQLPVLLSHVSWAEQRRVMPLLLGYENLYLTFNHYQVHYGLERLCALGLGKRLVYSSNAPEMSMGAHRSYVSYADISAEAKADIAAGNLRRLLKGQGPQHARVNPDEDALMRQARCGLPQQIPLYDMHAHMLHEGLEGGGGSCTMWNGGPAGTLALMRRLGYDGAGIMSWMVVSADAHGSNEMVKTALDAFPDTFWGLGTFDPSHYSREELGRMIAELYADTRFIGMKPYTRFGIRYDEPAYDVWWEFANNSTRRFYALIHPIAPGLREIHHLAPKYPNIIWIPVHCGGSFDMADLAIECIRRYPNVYAEITLTPVPFGMIDYLAENAGADRILYGSDLPMRDPRQQLGWVLYSRLSVEDKKKILGGNARRILRACGWPHA